MNIPLDLIVWVSIVKILIENEKRKAKEKDQKNK